MIYGPKCENKKQTKITSNRNGFLRKKLSKIQNGTKYQNKKSNMQRTYCNRRNRNKKTCIQSYQKNRDQMTSEGSGTDIINTKKEPKRS